MNKVSGLKSLKMKRIFNPLSFFLLVALASSCTTPIQMQRTYPPEMELPEDSARFVFINFYDYQIPDFIKEKDESAYAAAVKGYGTGLADIILKDPQAMLMMADTLKKGFTVMSMQYPGFSDTVRTICQKIGANILIALDSISLEVQSEFYLTENDEGGSMMAKDFNLFADTYMTLYTSDGVAIDRCAGEKSTYVKSKYTIFGMIGGPTLANRQGLVKTLTREAAKDCIGKFYPFTEISTEQLHKGGPLNELNRLILAGRPEEALEPLRGLAESSGTSLAAKAAHNLNLVTRILEEKKVSEEVWKNFLEKEQ